MSEEYRDLVICNNCLWAASLLRGSRGFIACPVCSNVSLDVIPVGDYEAYTMDIKKNNVEIEFRRENQ
jgi:4-hydroxy-3-methylbut-2-en-1-yl diphosphate synthase IspG/GcpE